MAFATKANIKKLNAKSVEYETYWREWAILSLLNEGGSRLRDSIYFDDILIARPKEPTDVYSQRKKRFTYQPILPNAVSWYTAKLFERAPEMTVPKSEFWDEFMQDCDKAGTQFLNFAADLFEITFINSVGYVLTDLPRNDTSLESLADQKEQGYLDPYLCAYSPLAVINHKTDRYGSMEWVVLKSETTETPFLGDSTIVTEWRYFDRQTFAVYRAVRDAGTSATDDNDSPAELVASGNHSLAAMNRVPVRRIELRKSMRLARRAYLQLLDHINQDNSYAWALFNANLAMMYTTGAQDIQNITLSEIGLLELPTGATAGWLEPSGQSFKSSQERLDSLRQENYRSFHLQAQGRDSSASAAASSGYSKELEMAPARDVLSGFGDMQRNALLGVLMDVADSHGDDASAINVAWPSFDQALVLSEIESGQALDTIAIQSDTLYKVRDRRVAMAYMQDESPADRKAVETEIESAPGKSEVEAAQQQAAVAGFQQALTKAGNRGMATDEIKTQDAAVAAA